MESASHRRTNSVGFHLREAPRAVGCTETERRRGQQKLGEGVGELVFRGDRVSLGDDDSLLEISCPAA